MIFFLEFYTDNGILQSTKNTWILTFLAGSRTKLSILINSQIFYLLYTLLRTILPEKSKFESTQFPWTKIRIEGRLTRTGVLLSLFLSMEIVCFQIYFFLIKGRRFLAFIKAFDSQNIKFHSIVLKFDSLKIFYISYKNSFKVNQIPK